jgi:hypothetical protein
MMKKVILHPFLLAIYFILFLFSYNIHGLPLEIILYPIIIIISFVLLCWGLLSFIFKNREKAGLVVTFFVLLFFTYGRFYKILENTHLIKWYIGLNKVLFLFWVIPIFLGIYFIVKTKKNLENLTYLFNIGATILVGFTLVNIGSFYLNRLTVSPERKIYAENIESANLPNLSKTTELPNIFYIILDSYSREDIIKKFMGYDNSEMIDYLTQKGFYIASKSMSNYEFTEMSLASSLNLDYIQQLLGDRDVKTYNKLMIVQLLKNSFVVRFLRRYGYKFVAFDSGISETQMKSADIFMASGRFTSDFITKLLESTLFITIQQRYNPLAYFIRKGMLYSLDHVQDTAKLDGPVFVFAHNMILHPPFLFGKDGEELSHDSLAVKAIMVYNPELYSNALIFLNKKIKKMVNDILSNSKRKTIIIIQGDHGVFADKNPKKTRERLSIFNAYYLPDGGDKHLYQERSPVNTFRVIFNHYFGTNYKILKDKYYHSPKAVYSRLVKISRN